METLGDVQHWIDKQAEALSVKNLEDFSDKLCDMLGGLGCIERHKSQERMKEVLDVALQRIENRASIPVDKVPFYVFDTVRAGLVYNVIAASKQLQGAAKNQVQ